MEITADGWPVYDLKDMKAEYSDGEELAVRILGDPNVGGFTPTKALKRELAQSIEFDESLIYCEDVHWLINILVHNKNIRACYMNYYLYCYVQHKNKGITRDAQISYTNEGFPRIIEAYEKILRLENISPLIAEQIKGSIYASTVGAFYDNQVRPSNEVRRKMKSYLKQYAFRYYFGSKHVPIAKIKTLIKRILSLLHIYKHKRRI